MLVKTVKLLGKTYSLAGDKANHTKNNFSVVIGVNGVGKSRLLSQIVSAIKGIEVIDSVPKGKTKLLDLEGVNPIKIYGKSNDKISYIARSEDANDDDFERINVIAVTTSPFDRFPVSYRARDKFKYRDDDIFHYIGLRVSDNNFNKTNLLNLLSRCLLKKGMCRSFKSVFNLLSYKNKIRIEFKSKIPPYVVSEIYSEFRNYEKGKPQKEYLLNKLSKFSETLVGKIKGDNEAIVAIITSLFRNFKKGNKCLLINKSMRSNEDLMLLLDMGIIQVKRIELYSRNDRVMDFSDSSSGEQCVLLSLLNLAGVIRDHSVVCIDEPEISLHPSWQRRYIKLLKECFKEYKGCHFIISTHSPLIVSELDEEDCHVLNMVENKIYPAMDYVHQSVDYQLATLFDTPGDNNEYLKRRVITLLSKNSRLNGLSSEELDEAGELIEVGRSLSNNDIVKQLILLLEQGLNKGEVNA